jgi:endonuclease/exonuclease/phosphatase family metal-dependent hydrolase
MQDRDVHDISISGREQRQVLEAVIRMPGGMLRVLATHLGYTPAENTYQSKRLFDICMRDASLPLLLLGDLNGWVYNRARRHLLNAFDSVTAHRSYPSILPVLPLDRIMCRNGARLLASHRIRKTWRLSDHLPVVATIDFADNTARQV